MEIEDLVKFNVNGKKCVAFVRKLTERECFRLMGVDEGVIDTIDKTGICKTAKYHLAGNSIVVDVLYHLFKSAFIDNDGKSEFTIEHPLRVSTLCSGYDAQFLALDRLQRDFSEFRYERVWYAEHDPESKKPDSEQPAVIVHEALFPNCPNLGDITKVDWKDVHDRYGDIDLMFYSTPCQSISQSGLSHGFIEGSGTRSSIIWNVRDAIDAIRPRFACLENVSAMLNKKFRPTFDLWCEAVSSFGYSNFFKVLNARDYGVPQNRLRVFMFSINKEKSDGEINYEFPNPIPLERRLRDVLDGETDLSYYLNLKNVQEFVKNNVENIVEYATELEERGEKIGKLPDRFKEWIKGF